MFDELYKQGMLYKSRDKEKRITILDNLTVKFSSLFSGQTQIFHYQVLETNKEIWLSSMGNALNQQKTLKSKVITQKATNFRLLTDCGQT